MIKKKFKLLTILSVFLIFLAQTGPLWSLGSEAPLVHQSIEDQLPEKTVDEELEEEPINNNLSPVVAELEEVVVAPTVIEEAEETEAKPLEVLIDKEAETRAEEELLVSESPIEEGPEPEEATLRKKPKLTYLWNQVKVFLGVRKVSLAEESFGADDRVGIRLRDYKAEELTILVFDSQEEPVAVLVEEDEGGISLAPAGQFRPGRHTIQVFEEDELILEQDFVWGVLAINTSRSVYLPDQVAKLSLAILDEAGMMVCGAKLELVITNQNLGIKDVLSTEDGTIIVNPECFVHGFTTKPDYEATYQVGQAGRYQMELTAETQNGAYSIVDAFEVWEEVPFEVERISATRVYPPEDYPVTLKIRASDEFMGVVEETVPAGFRVLPPDDETVLGPDLVFEENGLQKLVWYVFLGVGEETVLGYQFNAPNRSPQFYLLGPLVFRERQGAIIAPVGLDELELEETGAIDEFKEVNVIDPEDQVIYDPFLGPFDQENQIQEEDDEQIVVNEVVLEEKEVFVEARQWQLAIDASQTQTFTSSGSWQAPAGVTQVTVECWGGGGGGGGPSANKTASSGGGGGAYSKKIVSVTGGNSYSYTVGAGGAGGSSGNGSAGGDTYWVDTSTVLAKGGSGGSATTPGGAGGAAASGVGETKYSGGNGSSSSGSSSGAGGGGAGSTGNGGNASGTTAGTGTSENGGNGGAGRTSAGTPYDGSNYGGGGGGNYRLGSSGRTGGNGAPGLIRITYELLPPSPPTNVSATDGTYTDKVVVTWTKSTGATGYKVYEGSNLLATLGDVATYDDTTAPAPTITPGTASASDGTSGDYVALSLSGQSVNNGSSRTYKVVAFNGVGDSDDSTTDTGYRGAGSLTYQWQRSLADSDADYANIDGATTASYNDTGAPANGDGRYYHCVLNAAGASQQTSTSDRGYRAVPPNQNPNSPTSLAQKKTDDTSLAVGAWTNETSVKFSATVSDPDSADTLYLCVEKDILGTSFSGGEDLCGSGVAYSGTAVEATVTISGITDANQYHWQARVKDEAGAYSSWVSFGENLETEQDFGVDTSAPTGGTAYDGDEEGVDKSFNDGSLSQLSANWGGFDASVSGLDYYEYAIGTSVGVGGTDVQTWTGVGVGTSATATSLNLQTSQVYYFNVRAYDQAGNQTLVSSNGQMVAPSLTFSVAPSSITFDNLNLSNSYTDSKQTILTTSTNAYGGYVVRAFITDYLRSAGGQAVADFSGGTYESPAGWGESTGFGYHSSDTLVGGTNRFNSDPCPGGGSPPCFAPFSQSSPGDIIADHAGDVTGIPISSEEFTITKKVKVDGGQAAGGYSTVVVYTATAIY